MIKPKLFRENIFRHPIFRRAAIEWAGVAVGQHHRERDGCGAARRRCAGFGFIRGDHEVDSIEFAILDNDNRQLFEYG
jgi:hypothetical protein